MIVIYPEKQRGVVTLMFAVVLLIVLTSITFMTARILLTEQEISVNQYRTKEVTYAAEAALEYGIAWLNTNKPTIAAWNSADEQGDGISGNDLSADEQIISVGTDSYTLRADYLRNCILPGAGVWDAGCQQWLIEIRATAVASRDENLSRSQVIRVLQVDRDADGQPEYLPVPGSWRDW